MPLWRPIPIVTTVHDVEMHPGDRDTEGLPPWATALAVRQSDAFIVHGDALRRHAARRFGWPDGGIHVLSHPAIVRHAELARAEGLVRRPADGSLTLLMSGRIFAYEGLDLLLRAEAELGNRVPGLRIVMAGRGNDPWELRHLMGDADRYDVRNRLIEDRGVANLIPTYLMPTGRIARSRHPAHSEMAAATARSHHGPSSPSRGPSPMPASDFASHPHLSGYGARLA